MNHIGLDNEERLRKQGLKWLWPALLGLIWISMVVVVNPIGNFPLNDDWAYGYSVRALVEQGEIRFSDWTATNLIAQVVWGALFCLPYGFSFTALRLSTAVLGFAGILATVRSTRAQCASRNCCHRCAHTGLLSNLLRAVFDFHE